MVQSRVIGENVVMSVVAEQVSDIVQVCETTYDGSGRRMWFTDLDPGTVFDKGFGQISGSGLRFAVQESKQQFVAKQVGH